MMLDLRRPEGDRHKEASWTVSMQSYPMNLFDRMPNSRGVSNSVSMY
jgi:hypothetical protein